MTMDSGYGVQEQAQPADSDADAQDGVDSGNDAAAIQQRLNGLMKLVGKRTTDAEQQKARADTAEAALADAHQRLAAYEDGTSLTEADADALLDEESDDEIAAPAPRSADADFDYWNPAGFHTPGYSDPSSYVDPNSASRASLLAPALSETQKVRSRFDRELDSALRGWGIEGTD